MLYTFTEPFFRRIYFRCPNASSKKRITDRSFKIIFYFICSVSSIFNYYNYFWFVKFKLKYFLCDISTKSKYLNRPSPPRPANDVACRGRKFSGNDGGVWKSEKTSTGVYRWKRVGESVAKRSVKRSVKRKNVELKLSSKKVPELKQILRKCGEKVSGTKSILLLRIYSNCI